MSWPLGGMGTLVSKIKRAIFLWWGEIAGHALLGGHDDEIAGHALLGGHDDEIAGHALLGGHEGRPYGAGDQEMRADAAGEN
jgi:hypothetical protein